MAVFFRLGCFALSVKYMIRAEMDELSPNCFTKSREIGGSFHVDGKSQLALTLGAIHVVYAAAWMTTAGRYFFSFGHRLRPRDIQLGHIGENQTTWREVTS